MIFKTTDYNYVMEACIFLKNLHYNVIYIMYIHICIMYIYNVHILFLYVRKKRERKSSEYCIRQM